MHVSITMPEVKGVMCDTFESQHENALAATAR